MWTFDCGWAVYFEQAYLFELYIAVIGFDFQLIQLPVCYVKKYEFTVGYCIGVQVVNFMYYLTIGYNFQSQVLVHNCG